MRFFILAACVAFAGWAPVRPVRAAPLIGYVDLFTQGAAMGWACNPAGSAPVNVYAYAGTMLIGVYPTTVARPDVTALCRDSNAHGFTIDFDAAAQAQVAGQPQISLYAYAWGAPALFLPASNRQGANPLLLTPGQNAPPGAGPSLQIAARVAQSGSMSGITSTLFTAWMPPGMGFGGLTGQVGLGSNATSFSEGLLMVGTTADDEAACARLNEVTVANPPPITRLWAAILKNNSTVAVTIPVNFTLPFAVAPQQAASGTCVMTLVNAGFPYLDRTTARYTTMAADLSAALVPVSAGSAVVLPFGMGGEFRFRPSLQPLSVYVGIMANRPLAVDGIAGSASAAPVAGAPPGAGWSPVPAGDWSVASRFMYLPASVCAAGHFKVQPSQGIFSVLRMGTPTTMAVPNGAVPVLKMPMMSTETLAIQRSAYHAVPLGAPGGTLAPGDCLLLYETVYPGPGGNAGVLDVENQSTVYLRELPM
jgi:hypothetical protein